jgi:hypothetical protein
MDYKNGKIYAIRSHQTEQIYIGSTTQPLTKRLNAHKAKNCNSKLILQYEDAYIELIETYSCENREQLNKREGEHIRANNCVNKLIAGRTQKEYLEDNKELLKEKTKKYREENNELLKEKAKKYRENENKEKVKERNKKYKTENAEILKQKRKEYLVRKLEKNTTVLELR